MPGTSGSLILDRHTLSPSPNSHTALCHNLPGFRSTGLDSFRMLR